MRQLVAKRGLRLGLLAVGAVAGVVGLGCGELPQVATVRVDGSSTVAPIMSAAAEMFRLTQEAVDVSVGTSGTGNGFRKFLEPQIELRIDIATASRPIHSNEIAEARQRGIEFIELPVAYDGIVVSVNPGNAFCDTLTVEELRRIFAEGEALDQWSDVRPGFPALPLRRYGPGFEDGTFEFFADAVVGGKKNFNADDYEASEYDDLLVQAVARDRGGIAFFGFGYYHENRAQLKAMGIVNGQGAAVFPSQETIADGSYKPLTRPLFIYVNAQSAERPAVQTFLDYFFEDPARFVEHPFVGYVRLSGALNELAYRRLREQRTGSVFENQSLHGQPLERLYGLTQDFDHATAASARP